MRELSKTEMAAVSGAGLLDGLVNIASSTVNSVIGMVSAWTSSISYALGATVGLGMSILDTIARAFGGGKKTSDTK